MKCFLIVVVMFFMLVILVLVEFGLNIFLSGKVFKGDEVVVLFVVLIFLGNIFFVKD